MAQIRKASASQPEWVRWLGLARAEQENAKIFLRCVWMAQLASTVLALAALLVTGGPATAVAAGAVVCQLAAWALRARGLGLHRQAEEGRRRAQLRALLGADAEALDSADTKHRFSRYARKHAAQYEDQNYWGTTASPGPTRLAEALQESAFYSKHLYEASARWAGAVAAGFVVLLGVAVILALLVLEGNDELVAARVGAIVLGLWVALDLVGRAWAFHSAGRTCADIDRRWQQIDPSNVESAATIVVDYSVCTTVTPPIPTKVYERKKDELARLWTERRNG